MYFQMSQWILNSFSCAYVALALYVGAPGSEKLSWLKCCGDFWLAASLSVLIPVNWCIRILGGLCVHTELTARIFLNSK